MQRVHSVFALRLGLQAKVHPILSVGLGVHVNDHPIFVFSPGGLIFIYINTCLFSCFHKVITHTQTLAAQKGFHPSPLLYKSFSGFSKPQS